MIEQNNLCDLAEAYFSVTVKERANSARAKSLQVCLPALHTAQKKNSKYPTLQRDWETGALRARHRAFALKARVRLMCLKITALTRDVQQRATGDRQNLNDNA